MRIRGRKPRKLRLQPVNDNRLTDYRAFFDFYLRQHAHPACRTLHYLGTTLGTALLLAGLLTGRWQLVVLAPVAGYGLAWLGHFRFERNRPATFHYPLWSFISDYHMLALALSGRLKPALAKALTPPAEPAAPPPQKNWPSARIRR